jgi:hypothetical protein
LSSGWTFEVPVDQLRDGVIPTPAGPRQALERWIKVPAQFLHRSFQQLQCVPTARSPGGIGAQPVYSGFGVSLSTEILLCVA